MQKIYGND